MEDYKLNLTVQDRVLIRKGLYLLIDEILQDKNLFDEDEEEFKELTNKENYVTKLIQCIEEDYNYER